MRSTRPFALAASLVLAALAACSSGDPVREAVDAVVEAAEERDADAVGERLATTFAAADGADRDAALRAVRQYLGAYRSLDLEIEDFESVRQGSSARATFRVRLAGIPREIGGLGDLVPRTATYEFDVGLVEQDGAWRMVDASWSEVGRPGQ